MSEEETNFDLNGLSAINEALRIFKEQKDTGTLEIDQSEIDELCFKFMEGFTGCLTKLPAATQYILNSIMEIKANLIPQSKIITLSDNKAYQVLLSSDTFYLKQFKSNPDENNPYSEIIQIMPKNKPENNGMFIYWSEDLPSKNASTEVDTGPQATVGTVLAFNKINERLEKLGGTPITRDLTK